jgi:hypothetical protein
MNKTAATQTELRPTNRRLESFSDAVFAIVITIMVLGIQIPDSLAFTNDPVALQTFGAVFLTYALSFFVISQSVGEPPLFDLHAQQADQDHDLVQQSFAVLRLDNSAGDEVPRHVSNLAKGRRSLWAGRSCMHCGVHAASISCLETHAQRGSPRHPPPDPPSIRDFPRDLHPFHTSRVRERRARLGLLRERPADAVPADCQGPDRQKGLPGRPSRNGAFVSLKWSQLCNDWIAGNFLARQR